MSEDYDLSIYPASPILLATKGIDSVCSLLGCSDEWRSFVPSALSSWVQYKVGDVRNSFPSMLSYNDYLVQSSQGVGWASAFSYAFETPSTSLGDLTTVTSIVVLLILVCLLRLIKGILLPIFSSIGREIGRKTHGKGWELQNEIRIQKFGEYVFRLAYHFIISLYGVWYFCDKEWWDENRGGTTVLFRGYPLHPVDSGMAWYYLVQSAYNVEALVSLAELSFVVKFQNPFENGIIKFPILISWSKTVRGDFREMAIHHVVTNLLIIGSSMFRLTRVGSMVFLVHDISDVPVDLSKLANFLKWKLSTSICFITMVIFWLIFRLTILPFVIYRSVIFESYMVMEGGRIDPIYFCAYGPFFVTLVGLIILLHVLWFYMFLQMGYLLVFKGEAHDLSEHKKGETQDVAIKTNGTKKEN